MKTQSSPWPLLTMLAGTLSVVLVSAGLLSGCETSSDGDAVSQPNILFILVDDLGYKAVPPYGNPHQDLSNLDQLAEEGMTFMDAYVTPQCTPTRAALMTGQHTARNKMWHVVPEYGFPYARMREPEYRENLPRETYTMAEALQDNGYRTAQLGKWHLNTYEQGDGYYTYLFDDAKEYYGFDYVTPMQEPTNYHQRGDKGVRMLTDEAMGFMQRSQEKEQPFFIYLAHHTIHGPVLAPDSLVQKYQELGYPDSTLPDRYNVDAPTNAEYLGALKHLDNSIGRLMDKIEELGIEDNTMVVFLSDNGGVDDEYENYPLRYGKGSPYEGGVRVPFIVKWPETVRAGATTSTPVQAQDLYPTFVEAAGGTMKKEHTVDGKSLLPVLTESGSLDRNTIYWYTPLYDYQWGATPSASLREGDYKLIHFFGDHVKMEDGGKYVPEPKTVLYNVGDSPAERRNLADVRPDLTERLKKKLYHWIDTVGAEIPQPNPNYNRDSVFVRGPRVLPEDAD